MAGKNSNSNSNSKSSKNSKSGKTEARAAERAERLKAMEEQQRAQEKAQLRRRNLQIGGVVGFVLVLVIGFLLLTNRGNDIDAPAIGQSDYGLVVGPASAPRTVVVYEDFLCPGCGQLEATTHEKLAELAAAGSVRVEYRPFALLGRLGDYSARSTAAFGVVMEESGDEVALRFHDLLYADQPAEDDEPYPDADWLVAKAVEAGADETAVRGGIEAGENDFSNGATREAEDAGVQGTPTVLLDGEPFTGSPDELLDELQ